jgi:hypothetical protein
VTRVFFENGTAVPWRCGCIMTTVPEPNVPSRERRAASSGDRRRNSRSGRRNGDPRVNWRRVAWLFAAYAVYVSVRSLPETVRKMFQRAPAS